MEFMQLERPAERRIFANSLGLIEVGKHHHRRQLSHSARLQRGTPVQASMCTDVPTAAEAIASGE